MGINRAHLAVILPCLLIMATGTHAAEPTPPPAANAAPGAIVTLWPLFDYRSSPATAYSNLSILGPLFKKEHSPDADRTALRPLFFSTSTHAGSDTDILYPLASTSHAPEHDDTQILRLFRKQIDRPGTPQEKRDSMLFPFYISGQSEKYGPYTSVFPIYGDLYERFWRDEYHYVMFPLYGRTVNKGTTSTNYLYPFFNTVSGANESGFQFWPFYGHAAKSGVYDKRFALWPFYIREARGLDGDNPTRNLYLLPFYASSESPNRTSTHAPWPFCGTVRDGKGDLLERDIFWPFWMTARGDDSHTERYLPFYSTARNKEFSSTWVMWPFYRHQSIDSPKFRQDKINLLYFLFNRSDESWPEVGKDRARSAFWPLYAWQRDEQGVRTLTMPALTEAVIWNDGVERNWAPLWRIFIAKWDNQGNGATSILWNLFWREKRGQESAWELSPLVSYRSTVQGHELELFKGLFGYRTNQGESWLRLLWIPFGI